MLCRSSTSLTTGVVLRWRQELYFIVKLSSTALQTPENPSSSLFALFRPQTLGTAPDIPKMYRARNIYIMRGKKSFTLY